jgi:hypothetical protein
LLALSVVNANASYSDFLEQCLRYGSKYCIEGGKAANCEVSALFKSLAFWLNGTEAKLLVLNWAAEAGLCVLAEIVRAANSNQYSPQEGQRE